MSLHILDRLSTSKVFLMAIFIISTEFWFDLSNMLHRTLVLYMASSAQHITLGSSNIDLDNWSITSSLID